jgi:hypothetical protein
MEEFTHRENLIIFRRRLALAKDDAQRQLLLKLLAEEEGKIMLPKETRQGRQGWRPLFLATLWLILRELSAPAASWPVAAAKARYVLNLYLQTSPASPMRAERSSSGLVGYESSALIT